MKGMQWEHFVPVIITVVGGLLLWLIKLSVTALSKSLTRDLQREVERLKAEHENTQAQIDRNTKRIDYLIEKLIERNS